MSPQFRYVKATHPGARLGSRRRGSLLPPHSSCPHLPGCLPLPEVQDRARLQATLEQHRQYSDQVQGVVPAALVNLGASLIIVYSHSYRLCELDYESLVIPIHSRPVTPPLPVPILQKQRSRSEGSTYIYVPVNVS